jgi:hypothetical protein
MLGLFLRIWAWKGVRNLKVSCVGRGLMGYIRDKVNQGEQMNCAPFVVVTCQSI